MISQQPMIMMLSQQRADTSILNPCVWAAADEAAAWMKERCCSACSRCTELELSCLHVMPLQLVFEHHLACAQLGSILPKHLHSWHAQELLDQQRKEYEGTIARHLQFVDRLLKDKDDLSTRCAALANDVKVMSWSVCLFCQRCADHAC